MQISHLGSLPILANGPSSSTRCVLPKKTYSSRTFPPPHSTGCKLPALLKSSNRNPWTFSFFLRNQSETALGSLNNHTQEPGVGLGVCTDPNVDRQPQIARCRRLTSQSTQFFTIYLQTFSFSGPSHTSFHTMSPSAPLEREL